MPLLYKRQLHGLSLPAIVIWNEYPLFFTFASELEVRRERGRSLLLLYDMNADGYIQIIESRVQALIQAEPDLFLVEVRIKPTNNVKIFIDGDQGVSIERLVQLNRRLYKEMEEGSIFPNGDFSLEVSSPGLDEPLKMHRQYQKNIGRFAEVTDLEGLKKEGKLVSVDETGIVLEETRGKGKKAETIQHPISFNNIKTTKIQIKF